MVTYETIRPLCQQFGPVYARQLRRRRGRIGDTWHLDEVFVTIQGRQQYLWRAVDEDGDVLDILVPSHRNRRAAVRFFSDAAENPGPYPSTTDHQPAALLRRRVPHRDAVGCPRH